jgi:hypothetical protein
MIYCAGVAPDEYIVKELQQMNILCGRCFKCIHCAGGASEECIVQVLQYSYLHAQYEYDPNTHAFTHCPEHHQQYQLSCGPCVLCTPYLVGSTI